MIGTVTVRPLDSDDWAAVETIYREGIATGNATFEAEPPNWEQFNAGKLTIGRLVAVDELGSVLGWVAASPVSTREVYRGVVEHSFYVAAAAAGRGIGAQLLSTFIADADEAGVWTIQSSIFPENVPSLVLHDRAGFRIVGRRERIARMSYGPYAGRWRDTILVERRAALEPE